MKAKRAAKKAAKLANTQNSGLAEFQRIQTAPPALASKNQNLSFGSQVSIDLSKGELPRRNDGTSSSGSGLNETISEYEKLRLRNIEERNELFKSLFGPSHSHPTTSTAKKNVESDDVTSDEDFEVNIGTIPKRKLPTRNCTIQKLSQQKCPNVSDENDGSNDDSYASLDAFSDTLVENAIEINKPFNAEILGTKVHDDAHAAARFVINSIIVKVIGPRKLKRKVFIGKKSRRALKSSKYRKFHETDDQYQSRLKKSSALKQDNLKNEERSVRKRRLFRLKQARYV